MEKEQPLVEILRNLLKADRNLLLNREQLISRLQAFEATEYIRDIRSIEKAFNTRIGEIFLAADGDKDSEKREEAVNEAKEVLRDSGMQEKRVEYVVSTLQKALEWDKPTPEPETPEVREAAMEDEAETIRQETVTEAISQEPSWICECGSRNYGKFCTQCGKQNPATIPVTPIVSKETEPTQEMPQIQPEIPTQPPQQMPREDLQQQSVTVSDANQDRTKLVLMGLVVVLLAGGLFFAVREGIGTSDQNAYKTVAKQSENRSEDSSQPGSKPSESKKEPKMQSELSLGGMDLGLTVEQMRERLGKENGTETEGAYQFYLYDHVKVGVKDGIVDALVSVDRNASTKRGLHEGSTYQEVVDAYGTDSSNMDYNDLLLYEYTYDSLNQKKGLLRFAINKSDHRVNYISVRIPEEPAQSAVDVEGAQQAFIDYHKAITRKDFQTAFQLLSSARQRGMGSPEKFKSGYSTTISSVVEGLTIASAQPDQVVMYYNLVARDRAQGGVKVQTFSGTVTMQIEGGRWRIGAAESKKTGERTE